MNKTTDIKHASQHPSKTPSLVGYFLLLLTAAAAFIVFGVDRASAAKRVHLPMRAQFRNERIPRQDKLNSIQMKETESDCDLFEVLSDTLSHPSSFLLDVTEEISIANSLNHIYTAILKIGNPPQSLNLQIDTGSADLWVMSQNSSQRKFTFHTYYDPSTSSDFSSNNSFWCIRYGSSSKEISGVVSTDTIQLGDMTIQDQAFGEALSWSSEFDIEQEALDGVMGLAFQPISKDGAPSVIESLFNQHKISRMAFSFFLSKDSNIGSRMIIGEPDGRFFEGDLTFSDVIIPGNAEGPSFWATTLEGVRVADEFTTVCNSTIDRPCLAFIDTGIAYIGISNRIYGAFMARITKDRPDCMVVIDPEPEIVRCGFGTRHLPDVHFTFGGKEFGLTSKDYYEDGELGFFPTFPTSMGNDRFVFGDTFVKTFYTTFDIDNRQIGFARASTGFNAVTIALIAAGTLVGLVLFCIIVRFIYIKVRVVASPVRNVQEPEEQPAVAGEEDDYYVRME